MNQPFVYKDFPFGRLVFKYKEAGAVIMVRKGNIVVAGRFFVDGMPDSVKYAFRAKFKK